MKYIEIETQVQREVAEIFSAQLYDYAIQGVEIIDNHISEDEQKAMFVDALSFDNTQEEQVGIRFYLSEEEDIQQILEEIQGRFPTQIFTHKVSDDEDWAHNWKKFYKPFSVGQRMVVKPVWENLDQWHEFKHAEIVIDIDPGMAFGSGTHETTSLCMKAIEKYTHQGDTFVDVGCGSGILGIAAAKLGAGQGFLVDIDENACKIARENIKTNQVQNQLVVIQGNLVETISETVDFVVTNIFAEVIVVVAPSVHQILKESGYFIASGILVEKESVVRDALEKNGFEIIECRRDGEWSAFVSRAYNRNEV